MLLSVDILKTKTPIIDANVLRMALRIEQTITQDVPIQVESNTVYPFWTDGKWSYHQLIKQLIQQAGKADVYLSTWAITEEPIRVLHRLKTMGLINTIHGVFDFRLAERSAKGYAFAKTFFDSIKLTENHSKVTVIFSENIQITVIGSANWTKNKRLEAGTIFTDKTTADQFKTLLLNKISPCLQTKK